MTHVRPFALSLILLLTLPLLAGSPEETVREYLALAHEGRFEGLPKVEEGEGTERFEQKLRGVLRVRCARVDGIAIRAISEKDGTVDLDLAVAKRDREKHDAWLPVEITPLRVRVVERDGRWLVSAIEFADDELADRLIAAGPEERRKLFSEEADRITGDLARAVYGRAMTVINSTKALDAPPIAALAREIAKITGDRGAEALALGVDVIVARMKREAKTGVRIGRESVAIAEETGDPDVIARAWHNLTRLIVMENYERKDSSDEAVAAENHALDRALFYAERAENATLLVRVLENLALRASDAQDYFTARQYEERLQPVAREVGDRLGEIGYEIHVANLYFNQGDRELGFFHHKRAMELTERYDPRRYPYTLIRYGGFLVEDKRYDEAREAFAKALLRDERGAVLVTTYISANMVAFALRNLGVMAAEEGKLDEALCWLAEGEKLRPKSDPRYNGVVFAPYFAKRGDHATALRLSLQTLISGPNLVAMTTAARAYRALGNWDRAMALMREAIDYSEETDQRLAGGDEQQIRSADRIAGCYELAAELMLERGNNDEALAFLENGRGRVLAEVIENGRPGDGAAAEQAEEKVRMAQEQALARISVDLNRAVAAGERSAIASLEERLREQRHVYESFADGLRSRAERRHATRRRMSPSDIPQLLERLPRGVAAIEYFVARDQLHIFVARNDASTAVVVRRTVDVGRDEIEQKVTRFVKAISENDLRVRDAAKDLYALLIAPVEKDLRDTETLLVIPHEVIWRVSFAALADARGRYVVERWPLVYAPSITVFAEMAERRQDRRREPGTLLAVGNPTMDVETASNFRSYYRGAGLGSLPHAETEIDAVQRLYGSRQSQVLKRDEATEGRVKAAIPGAGVVHFATHGLLDDRNPMYSRLALARGSEATEDGWLETWEIARLATEADLVVLSACETARGRIGDGEGVVGMAWSFFVAGARSTLATQWKVESEHTSQLMIRFHEELRGDQDTNKARALREAQLQSIRDPRYRHPFYWAAFVLFGSAS